MKPRPFSTFDYDLAIVGESNYQPALLEAKEAPVDYGTGARPYVWANLMREPDSPYDENAIVVQLDNGETIGYLSRADAIRYAEAFVAWEARDRYIRCRARLAGGETTGILWWKRTKSIGVWLDIDTPESILAATKQGR